MKKLILFLVAFVFCFSCKRPPYSIDAFNRRWEKNRSKEIMRDSLLQLKKDAEDVAETKRDTDLVPNAETAIKIAIAVWLPIYGDRIYDEKPFHAELKNGIWFVYGTLKSGYKGGVAEAKIRKIDGLILEVIHGK